MKDYCFVTCYDYVFKEIGDGLVNSIKKFYPKADVIHLEAPRKEGKYDQQMFEQYFLEEGLKLLDEYKRIIYIDSDSIMCNECPDFFGDFDMGVIKNNIPVGPQYGGTKDDIYINNGFVVCANKKAWQEYKDEFYRRCNIAMEHLNCQNSLNHVFHNSSLKIQLLEPVDRCYGISGLDYYQDMELRDKSGNVCLDKETTPEDAEIYLPNNKKLCLFHAAGSYWKTDNKMNFELIKNELAREKLRSYIC